MLGPEERRRDDAGLLRLTRREETSRRMMVRAAGSGAVSGLRILPDLPAARPKALGLGMGASSTSRAPLYASAWYPSSTGAVIGRALKASKAPDNWLARWVDLDSTVVGVLTGRCRLGNLVATDGVSTTCGDPDGLYEEEPQTRGGA